MNILHIICDLNHETGGPVSAVYSFAKMQANANDRVTILSTIKKNVSLPVVSGVSIVVVESTFHRFRYSTKFEPLAKREILKADIIHVHTMWEYTTYIAERLCYKLKKPYILRPCGMIDNWAMLQGGVVKKLYYQLFGKRIVRNASDIHFTSIGEMESSDNLTAEKKGFVLGVPLDESYHELEVSKEKKIEKEILYVGRLHPHKRLEVIITSFSKIAKTRKNMRLIIVGDGDGDYKLSLMNLVKDLKIESLVIWRGFLDTKKLATVYQNAYLLLLLSMHENFGNVLIEAMSQGCPVMISTDVQIHRSIVDNNCGKSICVNEGDVSGLMAELVDDDLLRNKMSMNAREFVEKNYTCKAIYPKLKKLYQNVIKN